jgi:hypothetical protein
MCLTLAQVLCALIVNWGAYMVGYQTVLLLLPSNLCSARNMTSLTDVSQVRAFLGCCQQMSQYIKVYGITAAPLHGLTKKVRAFPKPWIKGEDYDLSFESLRSSILEFEEFPAAQEQQ